MEIGVYGWYKELGIAGAAAFVFWGIASVTLHELAHGWAAIWQGDDTPRRLDRMTWNPLVHMGLVSILMLLLVGMFWGLMPTDPSRYRWGRRGHIVVSGAGPAMNVALAGLCWTVVGVCSGLAAIPGWDDSHMLLRTLQFAVIGGSLNGLMALFNMLPLPPFDGASVLAGFSRRYYIWMHDPRLQQWGLLIAIVAMFSGIANLCAIAAGFAGSTWAALVATAVSVLAGQLG